MSDEEQRMSHAETAQRCADRMYSGDFASQAMGINIEVSKPGSACAFMKITAAMVNGLGVCHGGYLFALADTAFAFACNGYNRITVAAGASIDFTRPARLGDRLRAEAREQHRGRTTGLYEVSVTNQDGQLVALFHGRSHSGKEPLIPPAAEASVAIRDTNNLENGKKA